MTAINPPSQPTTVPAEVQEQAAEVLESLLENFVACSNGQHFEIDELELETDFSGAELGIKIRFRPVKSKTTLEGKPA